MRGAETERMRRQARGVQAVRESKCEVAAGEKVRPSRWGPTPGQGRLRSGAGEG